MTDEVMGNCAICDREIRSSRLKAKKIDGLWVCGFGCMLKIKNERRKWVPGNWAELCRIQSLYEEHKKAERKTKAG